MNEYKITIDFSAKTPQTPGGEEQPNNPTTPKSQDDGFNPSKLIKTLGSSALVAGTFKWQLSLVGRNQGASIVQDKINSAMSIAGMLGGIGAGFASGGPVGGMLAIAGVGLSIAKDVEQYNYNARWENIGLSLAKERAGSSSAVNRSRNV